MIGSNEVHLHGTVFMIDWSKWAPGKRGRQLSFVISCKSKDPDVDGTRGAMRRTAIPVVSIGSTADLLYRRISHGDEIGVDGEVRGLADGKMFVLALHVSGLPDEDVRTDYVPRMPEHLTRDASGKWRE